MAKSMTGRAAVGIADHIGWAELVTVQLDGASFTLLDRRRVELIDPGLATAPYHHESLVMPLAEAERLVARVTRSVAERCRAALTELRATLSIEASTLQQSPFEQLPDSLARVLDSRQLTCAADGMLYRESLAGAAAQLGLAVDRYARKSDQLAEAAAALGVTRAAVAARLAGMGREAGPPWRKEHQVAAAAAMRVLAGLALLRGATFPEPVSAARDQYQ